MGTKGSNRWRKLACPRHKDYTLRMALTKFYESPPYCGKCVEQNRLTALRLAD